MSELRPDYGDVTAEYRAARLGTGYASGTLATLWVEGPDAVSFLDGQVSQDLAAMEVGTVARSLLLSPRGKLVAHGWVVRGAERAGLVIDAAASADALDRLTAFMFRVDASLHVDTRPHHEVWGRGSVDTAIAAGLDPGPGWSQLGDRSVVALEGRAVGRVLVIGGAEPLEDAGAIRIGAVVRDTIRIEAGEPVMGVDVDDSTIPQETGLVPESVSFTKGCYVGQELVARIDSRGRVNRRLAGLVVATNIVPPVGAVVIHDGDERGTVTSVGESLTLRAPVAMAMVRREAVDGADITIAWDGGSAPAVVRSLPLDDFSDEPHTPRTPDDDGVRADKEA